MIGIKKAAVVLAAGGTALGLISMGVGASFVDGATATQNISTGSFGCAISSTTPGANVVGKTVTLTSGPLMASTAGAAPFVFKVASTGVIPVKVHITQTTPAAPFTSMLTSIADVTLPSMGSNLYAAGLQWPELVIGDTSKSTSISYTASCTEASAPAFSALTGTAGFYSDQYSSWTASTPPVVDMAASTITWTVPVNTAANPTTSILMQGAVPASPQGRFVAVPVTGNVSVLASVSVSSGLAADASKFQAIYRTVTYGISYGNLTAAGPFTGLNLATTGWTSHNATDNGLGVTWAGVTGTGTVTVVLAFSTN
jgi:hypothetical protein